MNCHIIIRRKNSEISIRGKFEDLKPFLPQTYAPGEFPERFTFRDDANRRIEVAVTPDAPVDAKIGIDLARQYLINLSGRESGETIRIGRRELTRLIRELQHAGESV